MVKNTTGGSRIKSQGRKFVQKSKEDEGPIRIAENELEQYAAIVKLFGHGRCQVLTNNAKIYHAIIRNYAKKQFKLIHVGALVLVQIRPWVSTQNVVDLILAYSNSQALSLLQRPDLNLRSLEKYMAGSGADGGGSGGELEHGFIFSDAGESMESTFSSLTCESSEKVVPIEEDTKMSSILEDDEVDIDDI